MTRTKAFNLAASLDDALIRVGVVPGAIRTEWEIKLLDNAAKINITILVDVCNAHGVGVSYESAGFRFR